MYAVIRLTRRVLISPYEVINNISSGNSLGIDKVLHSIVIAEERFVRPFLGWDLYEAFLDAKNRVVTDFNIAGLQMHLDPTYTGSQGHQLKNGEIVNASELLPTAYRKLWDEHLCKYISECVKFVSLPDNYAEFTNQGIVKHNPEVPVLADSPKTAVGVSLNDVKWLMDKTMNERTEVLKSAMHTFICRNISDYPGYIQPCECNDTKPSGKVKSSWIDVSFYYDEDEEDDCCQPAVQHQPSPTPAPKLLREQWVTIPSQTQYPYPGQFNEAAILERLKYGELITLTQEGIGLYMGSEEGEAIGLDPETGRITWVSPAPDQEKGLRMEAVVQK